MRAAALFLCIVIAAAFWPCERVAPVRAAPTIHTPPTPSAAAPSAFLASRMESNERGSGIDVAPAREKFRYLLEHTRLPASQVDALLPLLARFDSLANDYEAPYRETQLAELEGQIRRELHPNDVPLFTQLTQSDAQLAKFAEYTAGVSNLEPLSTSQELALLAAWLRQGETLRHSPESITLHAATERFLTEMRAALTPLQWERLHAYEMSELARAEENLALAFEMRPTTH